MSNPTPGMVIAASSSVEDILAAANQLREDLAAARAENARLRAERDELLKTVNLYGRLEALGVELWDALNKVKT